MNKTSLPSSLQKAHKSRAQNKEVKKRQIAAMMTNPAFKSKRQMAEVLGISREYAQMLVKEVKQDLAPIDQQLREYYQQFEKRLSIADAAGHYIDLASGKRCEEQPMVQLKALERIDALRGIVTARELKESGPIAGSQPMFFLPPGSHVQVNMSNARIPPVVDLKPQSSDPEPVSANPIVITRD